MGRAKAMLPFGPELMLQRVVRLLGESVAPVVVVAAPGQALPKLPSEVVVRRDRQPDRGPLEGLAVGLRVLVPETEAAFVTACDVPLLLPEIVRRVVESLEGYDAAVPHVKGFDEPLSAAYRTSVLPHIEWLLNANRLRPAFLFERVRTRRIAEEGLTDLDPHLDSLANVNSPKDYRAALVKGGFPADAQMG
jgi:molybdopterin-guanine dinucleotide biosynthesis protein A